MGMLAMIDGDALPAERAVVSVFDRGFLFGDSVFEALRTYGGRPCALDEHLERLEQSAALVHIEMPASRRHLAEEVRRALEVADNPESYVRIMVTRGTGELGLDPTFAGKPRRVVLVAPLRPPANELYEHGISVITFPTLRTGDGTAASAAKIANYLVAVLALAEARARGATDALVVDAEGRVIEGITSNLFFCRAGRLLTPPLELGALEGITRRRVLALAASLGLGVELTAPRVPELLAAEEVFLTSSIREIVPVVRVDGETIGSGAPGATARLLHAEYLKKVRYSG